MDGAAWWTQTYNSRSSADFFSTTMNKLLKKKAIDGPVSNDDALRALSQPPLPSPAPKKSGASRWKKNKKPEPAPRPELDVSIALPSTDDFRTSLLMPSLSTRFSMLREQDDPNSLLGKASDDSVLHPRRRSRLGDFGCHPTGLSDIAEVSSVHGSIRPPFAQASSSRADSTVSEDGYSSEVDAQGGSIMQRSRPGEGNILFGGRQKIYKIAGSGANSTKSLGKVMYDDDVGMSAFQRYRQREREHDASELPRSSDDSQMFEFGLDKAELDLQDDDDGQHSLPNDSAKDLCHSPSLSSYDRKRSTTSSDARSIARSSTAATSVASQTLASAAPSPAHAPTGVMTLAPAMTPMPDRVNTKPKRLYEQGLDQHLQEQQSTALSRLNSIQRQRAMSGKNVPPFLHSTKSAGNLQERSQSPSFAFRSQSPQLMSPNPLSTLGSIRRANSATSSPLPSGPQSPVDGYQDEASVLAQALEPADRGKATAMGAFNKPAFAFDEQQYLERQKQLQRSASNAALKSKAQSQSALQQRINAYNEAQDNQSRGSHNSSARAGAEAASRKHEGSHAYDVFQKAVSKFPTKVSPPPASKSPLPDTHRTFFGNISASDDEDEEEESQIAQSFNQPEYGYGGYQSKWQPTILPSVSEHPAMRQRKSPASLTEECEEEEEGPRSPRNATAPPSQTDTASRGGEQIPKALDSPTLPGAEAVGGINGMMHHLRQKSNESSIYPADEPKTTETAPSNLPNMPWNCSKSESLEAAAASLDPAASLRDSHYTASNPWDLDETRSLMDRAHFDQSDTSSTDAMNQSNVLGSQDTGSNPRQNRNRDNSELSVADDDAPSWQQELRGQHTRDASIATQEGRDAFSRELAARREAVKENLRSVVDVNNGSRSNSPVPPPLSIATSGSNGLRAFGALRAKTSRESLAHMRDHPSTRARNERSPDTTRPRADSSTARLPMPPRSQHPAFKTGPPDGFQESENSDVPRERQLASSRSVAQMNGRNRSRSNSAATGSSRSRTGPFRDDLEKAMVEGRGSSSTAHEFTPDVSPGLPGSDRSSDGCRTGMQTYFEHRTGRTLQPVDTQLGSSGPTPAATPSSLTPNIYTPGRPVPVANAYSENPTPPLSGSSPAISPSAFSAGVPFPARGTGLRKRTITKYDISEPTLISSTSNVDTVDLPPGASLQNGREDAPPIPPINPRRRGTRKMFGLGSKESQETTAPVTTRSDPNLLTQTSPKREAQVLPGNVMRMPAFEQSSVMPQYSGSRSAAASPELTRRPDRAVASPMDGGMF